MKKILLTICFLALPFVSKAAITINATSTGNCTACGSALTLSSPNIGSGANSIFVFTGLMEVASAPIGVFSSVTLGGQNLTQASTSITNSNRDRMDIWYLVNPPTGSSTLVANYTGSPARVLTGSASWFGVNQSTPFRGYASSRPTSVPVVTTAIALTGQSGDTLIDVACSGSGITSSGQTTQLRVNVSSSFACFNIGNSSQLATTSSSMTWNSPSDNWNHLVASMEPAPTGGGSFPTLTILGTLQLLGTLTII